MPDYHECAAELEEYRAAERAIRLSTAGGTSTAMRQARRRMAARERSALMAAPANAIRARQRLRAEPPPELQRQPLVANQRSFGWISDRIASLIEGKTPVWWWVLFIPSVLALGMLLFMLAYLISTGVGVWGNMHPVMWALGHRQLRLLDRHRPRRHADLGDPVPAAPALAHRRSTARPKR